MIVLTVFHDSKPVHLRHDDVKNDNIRFSFFYDITDFFSVVCFTYQGEVFVFFDHTTKYFYHFFVIVCDCYI